MKRSTPLRSKTPLKRRTPMRPYRPDPHWRKVRQDALSRANGWCEARIEGVCTIRAEQAHHLRLRSQGGEDAAYNLLAVCAADHRWIHDHPAQAVEMGLIWQRRAVA